MEGVLHHGLVLAAAEDYADGRSVGIGLEFPVKILSQAVNDFCAPALAFLAGDDVTADLPVMVKMLYDFGRTPASCGFCFSISRMAALTFAPMSFASGRLSRKSNRASAGR